MHRKKTSVKNINSWRTLDLCHEYFSTLDLPMPNFHRRCCWSSILEGTRCESSIPYWNITFFRPSESFVVALDRTFHFDKILVAQEKQRVDYLTSAYELLGPRCINYLLKRGDDVLGLLPDRHIVCIKRFWSRPVLVPVRRRPTWSAHLSSWRNRRLRSGNVTIYSHLLWCSDIIDVLSGVPY